MLSHQERKVINEVCGSFAHYIKIAVREKALDQHFIHNVDKSESNVEDEKKGV